MNPKRRLFIFGSFGFVSFCGALLAVPREYIKKALVEVERFLEPPKNLPTRQVSDVFLAKNGSPQENVLKVVDMMGGITRFIGINDIVLLKPNAQWWNQGRTNLAAMKGFIDAVLSIPGFEGEIIVGENQHFMDNSLPENEKDNVRGWVKFGDINGDIDGVNHNLNTLVELYQKRGIKNVTKSHWRDGGPKAPVWCNAENGGTVSSPAEGDGYVWTDNDYIFEGLWGLKKWKVKMTYPIFTSTYSGITIDFKHGAFQRDGKGAGRYLPDRKLKFVNFSVLNDHGDDTGITGAVKNYMGITDLSCGWWGLKPEGYVMVHECGSGYYPYAKGGPLGHFLKHIRKADLNIVTAEWVGWGDRTDVSKATRMKTILAGVDPVALDYYGAKHLVYPLSKNSAHHDPDNSNSAISKFLQIVQRTWGQGSIGDSSINVYEHDFLKS
ncbi:MAG: DUF362 domain-containing protein [Desulfobulbaceae bacterium]|nr:MAG: DUF362 domain-containing protein [Desulfobulbaceae bacterium]